MSIILAGEDFDLEGLVRRAVRNARPRAIGDSEPRWASVGDAFALGSTMATALCRHFELDPHESLTGPECHTCAEEQSEEDFLWAAQEQE